MRMILCRLNGEWCQHRNDIVVVASIEDEVVEVVPPPAASNHLQVDSRPTCVKIVHEMASCYYIWKRSMRVFLGAFFASDEIVDNINDQCNGCNG